MDGLGSRSAVTSASIAGQRSLRPEEKLIKDVL